MNKSSFLFLFSSLMIFHGITPKGVGMGDFGSMLQLTFLTSLTNGIADNLRQQEKEAIEREIFKRKKAKQEAARKKKEEERRKQEEREQRLKERYEREREELREQLEMEMREREEQIRQQYQLNNSEEDKDLDNQDDNFKKMPMIESESVSQLQVQE